MKVLLAWIFLVICPLFVVASDVVVEENIPIPLFLMLSSPIEVGQTIRIIATARSDARRFNIDFHNDNFSVTDIPLHLSIRWDEGLFSNKIVYNAQSDGKWNDCELRIKHQFKRQEELDLRIRFITNSYQIFGDRKLLGVFKAINSVETVGSITISGDLAEIRYVQQTGKLFGIPYGNMISLVENDKIDITGIGKGKRIDFGLFDVNRECVLIISIRFNEKAVVRNTQTGQQWGNEERNGGFPIKLNELFDLTIIYKDYGFQIYFNGEHFAAYSHRRDAKTVRTYRIDGNFEMHSFTHDKNTD